MSTVVLHAKSHKPKESTAIQPMRDEKRTTSRWRPNNLRLTLSKDFRSRATHRPLCSSLWASRRRAHAQHQRACAGPAGRSAFPSAPRFTSGSLGFTLLAPVGVSPGWLAAGCFRCSSVRRTGRSIQALPLTGYHCNSELQFSHL